MNETNLKKYLMDERNIDPTPVINKYNIVLRVFNSKIQKKIKQKSIYDFFTLKKD